MIPAEAVIAATKILYADKMSNHSGDNAPQIIDACEAVVKKILEAAAPYMIREAKAEAWEEGFAADDYEVSVHLDYNPYRRPL